MVRAKVLKGGEQKIKIQIRERGESTASGPAVWDQNQQEGAGRLQGSSRTKKPRGVNQRGPQRPGGPVHAGAVESMTE